METILKVNMKYSFEFELSIKKLAVVHFSEEMYKDL